MKEPHRIPSIVFLNLALLFVFLSPSSLPAQTTPIIDSPKRWITNFKDAKESAAAEKKDLAILFTASDWLDLAQTFDQEILNQEKFLKSASEHYTLLRLDFPKDTTTQSKQTAAQNQLLMQAYRIQGFPTLILTDSLGRPYAITGYHDGGLDSWMQEFNQLRKTREKRDRLFNEAKKATGVERAKLLVQAVPELPGNIAARFYRNLINEIIKLDPENQTGRVGQYKLLIADVRYVDQMQKLAIAGADTKMLELSDQYLKQAKLEGASLQSVLFHKIGIYTRQGKKDEVVKLLQEIITADPDSRYGKQAEHQLKESGSSSKKED